MWEILTAPMVLRERMLISFSQPRMVPQLLYNLGRPVQVSMLLIAVSLQTAG
jgi:hypothetical protein